MTPDQITAAARRIALSGIQEEIDDAMGLGEQLEDELPDPNVDSEAYEAALEAVAFELEKIQDWLREQWATTEEAS